MPVGAGAELRHDFGQAVNVVSGVANGIRGVCQFFPSSVESCVSDDAGNAVADVFFTNCQTAVLQRKYGFKDCRNVFSLVASFQLAYQRAERDAAPVAEVIAAVVVLAYLPFIGGEGEGGVTRAGFSLEYEVVIPVSGTDDDGNVRFDDA